MADQVRLGVIGTSWYTDAVLLTVLSAHPGATVAALCGRNRERAEEMAGKHGVPAVFADYREMYERAGLDAVVVASPDDLHFAMTMDALDAGLHVLCEKPMALTLADARAMLARAEAARREAHGQLHLAHGPRLPVHERADRRRLPRPALSVRLLLRRWTSAAAASTSGASTGGARTASWATRGRTWPTWRAGWSATSPP